MQSIDSIETYTHRMSKDLVCKKEEINCSNIIKQYKSRPNWPEIHDYPYRILIVEGSGSGKTNALFNLINNEQDFDKIYLYKIHMKQNINY